MKKQNFNPVTEAKSIFIEVKLKKSSFTKKAASLPANEDLEFPEIKNGADERKKDVLPDSTDLEFPDEVGEKRRRKARK